MRYFLIPKSQDFISHNPGISGLKNGGIPDPGIAIPTRDTTKMLKKETPEFISS